MLKCWNAEMLMKFMIHSLIHHSIHDSAESSAELFKKKVFRPTQRFSRRFSIISHSKIWLNLVSKQLLPIFSSDFWNFSSWSLKFDSVFHQFSNINFSTKSEFWGGNCKFFNFSETFNLNLNFKISELQNFRILGFWDFAVRLLTTEFW